MDKPFSAKELADALGVSVGSTTRKITKFQFATEQVVKQAAMSMAPNAGNTENVSKAFRAWLQTAAKLYNYDSAKADEMVERILQTQLQM